MNDMNVSGSTTRNTSAQAARNETGALPGSSHLSRSVSDARNTSVSLESVNRLKNTSAKALGTDSMMYRLLSDYTRNRRDGK